MDTLECRMDLPGSGGHFRVSSGRISSWESVVAIAMPRNFYFVHSHSRVLRVGGNATRPRLGWVLIRARERTIFDESWIYRTFNGWEEMMALFLLTGTLISLYFMYNVRTTEAA